MTEELPVKVEKEFPVLLNKTELFEFTIVKGDLRMSVEVRDPGGKQVVEYQSQSYEPIELSVVADTSGVFLVKIRSLETAFRPDQFILTVRPIRRATANDIKNAAARSVIAAATRLCAEWSDPSFKKAIEKYTEAAVLAADSRIASAALRKGGETRFLLGEYRPALELFERAAALSERAKQWQDVLAATIHAARLHSLLGNNDRAQRELNQVLSSYSDRNIQNQTPAYKHAYAQALNYQGQILYSRGEFIRSPDFFDRALKLFTEVMDRSGQASSHLFAGHLADSAGQLERAMAHFQQAYDLYRDAGNKSGEGLATTAKGITLTIDGKDEEGLKLHRDAIKLFDEIGDVQSKAIALTAIGQAYQNLHKNELALDHYKQALKLFQKGGTVDFIPIPVFQIASLYKDMHDLEGALRHFEDCARLSRLNKKRRMEAYALNEIASIYAAQGKHRKAYRQYLKIYQFHAATGDRRGQVFALTDIGDLHLSLGQKREGLASYKQALRLSQPTGDRAVEIETLYNVARASFACGAVDEARVYIERSIDMIETLRTNVASPDNRTSYFSGLRKHYDLYISVLMQLETQHPGSGFVQKALLASEGARARAFLELLSEAGADIRDGVDPGLLKREKELQRLFAAHALYQIEAAGSTELKLEHDALNERLDLLKAEYEELQAQVRNQSPRYQTLVRPKPLTINEIQAQLRSDDLLLEYVLGEEKSYLWAVTSTSLNGYELKSRSEVEAAALEVYKLITARQDTGATVDDKYQSRVDEADKQSYRKALELSRMLLGPVANVLGKKRLVIVTEGVLQYVPFDALPRPVAQTLDSDSESTSRADSFLISDHEIVSLPSVSALAAIRGESNRPVSPAGVVAVFADPVFSSTDARVQRSEQGGATQVAAGLPAPDRARFRGFDRLNERGGLHRLAYSSDEADSILAAASGNAWVVKGFEASRENVMSDQLGRYQIVHFATHGFVNTERPELSGIVLAMVKPDGTPADGFLQLHDVFNLKLSAELTVLSACDSGLGKDVRGEGLIGLTRGLMFAGSRSVVASLWKVDDRATAVLMGHFYKALLQDGLPRAAALRYAKEQLRKDPAWSSPFFWAGFVLQGEYDKPIAVAQTQARVVPITIVLVILAVVAGSLLILRKIYRVRE